MSVFHNTVLSEDELIDIVDIQGLPIWETIYKKIAHTEWILHRVVHVHFYDSQGNIFFPKT